MFLNSCIIIIPDSTGKREAESDVIEGTPPTKKHKSEDEGAVTQDVTISSHDDATAPLAEAETSLSPGIITLQISLIRKAVDISLISINYSH